jgi:hypothetical protein
MNTKALDRCDRCGRFDPIGQLVVADNDDDAHMSICKRCDVAAASLYATDAIASTDDLQSLIDELRQSRMGKSVHPIYPPGPFDEPVSRIGFAFVALTNAVAEIRNETPENQRRLLGIFLTLLERAGVAVPEVWRCSLEEMD